MGDPKAKSENPTERALRMRSLGVKSRTLAMGELSSIARPDLDGDERHGDELMFSF